MAKLGLAMAKPFGVIGSLLFASVLFVTCLGASLECVLALSYNIAQGFGWEWGENKKPVEAARFNLVIVVLLLIAFLIGLFGFDPLQLALFASTVIALFLPISLLPFLVIMNDPQYLGNKINGRWTNIAVLAILADCLCCCRCFYSARTTHRRRISYMSARGDDIFSIADIMDSQLETRDKKNIGRVADIEAVWREDGTLVLTDLVTGPQALAGRVARPLRTLFQRLLQDHFEQRIPLKEIEEFGPTLRLHKKAKDYPVGQSERWIADHILRWIPGSGHS